ncbi:MAG: phosphate-starvation-inducible PsiE family protein [Oscillatoriales cyanobacterium C42_A2020_001]|nr:phosphate-starvation-inducible PsiE family protein [Leptolyngbyaceae cyanobacterium C42_A2020_001]
MRRLTRMIRDRFQDDNFLETLSGVEVLVSKVLSIAMILVILVAVYNLTIFLVRDFLIPEVMSPDFGRFSVSLFKIFGLFLNVLIALEILENITAYLKKHVIQVELVIVTSLIAVARKIIILDLDQKTALELIGLAFAIFALASSYWIVRHVARKSDDSNLH